MLLRRGAVILTAFLVVVSCQKRRQALSPEPSQPTHNGNSNLDPLNFIFNADDNSAILFGYELVERIREIQVGCAILKREEELDFNFELDGMMKYYEQTKNKVSRELSRGDISEEEKERIETQFQDAFVDMNEERTDELAAMQRGCDRQLKRLLESKKMEAIGYAEALLRTDPAKFTQLCFDIADYRRQITIGLDACLQSYEGKYGVDPSDMCYEDAINVLLEFTHQFIAEISQLPQQFYGDDEDFVNLHLPGSGERAVGSGEEPIPQVTRPSVPDPPAENQPSRPIDYDSREIVRLPIPTGEEPIPQVTRPSVPAPPAENQPSHPIDYDSKEIVRIHIPTEAPSPGKTPPATGKQPSSEPPTGTRGPTKIHIIAPTDEQPSSQSPAVSEDPTTEAVVTKVTLPPKFTFRTHPTEVGATVPVSRPTLPPKTEKPRKELPSVAVDQGTNEILDEKDGNEVEGTLEVDLPGVGVDVQVGVGDNGVEVDVDVTTETPQDGDESENVPNTAGTVEIISDYDSEDGSEHRRPESSSEHLPSEVGQSEQVYVDTDETEETSDDDSGSKEEGEEEEGKANYQHILIYAFMIVGSLLVIVVIILILAILAVRRRRNSFKDSPLLSEEQTVAIMKHTGFVNPTYKFFDQVNDS